MLYFSKYLYLRNYHLLICLVMSKPIRAASLTMGPHIVIAGMFIAEPQSHSRASIGFMFALPLVFLQYRPITLFTPITAFGWLG